MKTILFFITLLIFSCSLTAIEHPHLLFDKNDLPELKKKIKSGSPAKAYTALLKRCDKYAKGAPFPGGYYTVYTRGFDPMSELLFAWYLSGDNIYKQTFLRLFEEAKAKNFNLARNYLGAWIFDMGYDILSQDDKAWLKAQLVKERRSPKSEDFLYYSNYILCQTKPPLNALALLGEPEYDEKFVTDYVQRIRNNFRCFVGKGGIPIEGGIYLEYGMTVGGAVFTWALHRKGYDFNDTNLKEYINFRLQTALPKEFSHVPVGDSRISGGSITTIRLLARLFPNHPLMPYMLLKQPIDSSEDKNILAGILFYQDIVPTKETDSLPEGLVPHGKFYHDDGTLCYKSDMTEDAFYLYTQTHDSGGHGHEDSGSFILFANGYMWVTETDYGKYDMGAHNSVLIDGNGNGRRGGVGATVENYFISPAAVYMESDLTSNWNCFGTKKGKTDDPVANVKRSIAAITEDKGLNIPPYVMVLDNVQKNQKRHKYAQAFQFDKNANFDIKDQEVIVTNPNAPAGTSLLIRTFSFEPNKSQIRYEDYKDFGRFPNDYKRLLMERTALVAQFATMLYPRKDSMPVPTFKEIKGPFFKFAVQWPTTTDYWVWKDPEDDPYLNTPELAMIRIPKGRNIGHPREMGKTGSCYGFNIRKKWGFNRSSNPDVANRWNATAKRKNFYRNTGASMSFSFRNQELYVELFTPLGVKWEVERLTECQIFAPNTKRVVVNGKEVSFSQDGDFVRFTAMSYCVKDWQNKRLEHHRKMLREYEAVYFKNLKNKGKK
jgi:hypothetical protein